MVERLGHPRRRLRHLLLIGFLSVAAGTAIATGGASLALAAGDDSRALDAREAQLRADGVARLVALADKCDELGLSEQAWTVRKWEVTRAPGRQVFFVPPAGFSSPGEDAPRLVQQFDRRWRSERERRASELFELARERLAAGDAARAFCDLHEVLREDPEHAAARHVLGFRRTDDGWVEPGDGVRRRTGLSPHPHFGWRRGRYWIIESAHFRVVTDHSPAAGTQLIEQLEKFHCVWRQLFFPFWGSGATLADRLAGGEADWGPRRRYDVVLFRDRDEYLEQLARIEPRIAVSNGYYSKERRTAYLFWEESPVAESPVARTWYHEVGHQLFQESGEAIDSVGERWNFWLVEGVAVYLESLVEHDTHFTVGGFDADRLQVARYRTLRGAPGLPLDELVQLGRDSWQRRDDIRELYTQAAGLGHFLLDGENARLREPAIALLRAIYAGRDTVDALAVLSGKSFAELQEAYGEFLQVTDVDLQRLTQPARQRELCLGMTRVTDAGLRHVAGCRQLEWLDLSFTATSDAGVAALGELGQLERLSLEGTRITDAAVSTLVARMPQLNDLDLAHTAVTDTGVQQVGRLPELTTLYLTKTMVTDAVLPVLDNLPNLVVLDVTGTRMTAAGRERLQQRRPDLKVTGP